MRMHHISSSLLLFVLLLEHGRKGANAFGVTPPRRTTITDSSLYAVEPLSVVEVITNGGSIIVDAATAAAASIAPVFETASSKITNFAPAEILNKVIITSSFDVAVVGSICGASGLIVGVVSQKGENNTDEADAFEIILQEKTLEINDLNALLAETEVKRNETQVSGEQAIDRLENQIFLMDQEFENSTETLKNDYEKRIQQEIQKQSEKIKQDFKFKYDNKMIREQEHVLQEKLVKQEEISLAKLEAAQLKTDLIRSETNVQELRTVIQMGKNPFSAVALKLEVIDLQNDLASMESNMLEKEQKLVDEVTQLQTDLIRSEKNIQELRTITGKNPFSAVAFKLEVIDLQKDLAAMESSLLEKEQQIKYATQEIKELETKEANPLSFVTELFQPKSAA